MNVPNLIPEYIPLGLAGQEIVIEYSSDLPAGLMTLTILYSDSGKEYARVPTNSLGATAAKAMLPAFDKYGFYTVIPKFPAFQDPKFPPFQLRVLSQVETLINTLVPDEDPYNATKSQTTNSVVAALLAYLIQNEQQGLPREDSQIIDQVLSQILMNLENPVISLAQFLCGQYIVQGETLLHFCIRHNYMTTVDYLTQYSQTKALQQSLAMKGYDGTTPIELAKMFQLHDDIVGVLKDSSVKLGGAAPNETINTEDKKPAYNLASAKLYIKRKTKFDRIKNAIKTKTTKKAEDDTATEGKAQDLLLKHLKITSLYSAEIVEAYDTVDKDFGTTSLKVGDVAFITCEEDKYWCTGIVNEGYYRFPRSILHQSRFDPKADHSVSVRDKIPPPKELVSSNTVHDFEDLEQMITERKKYAKYADEKHFHSAHKQLSYITPVTRSCSVETGLDEISNCSPLLKRNPIVMPQKPKIGSHKNIPLPQTPDDDSDSDEGYEFMVFDNAPPVQSKNKTPSAHTPPPRPVHNPLNSPVFRNRQKPPNVATEATSTNRVSVHSTTSSQNEDAKRESIISTRSNPSDEAKRHSLISNKSAQSSQSGEDKRDSIISNKSYQSATAHQTQDEISDESDDSGEYDDVATLMQKQNPEGNPTTQSSVKTSPVSSGPVKRGGHNYVNVSSFLNTEGNTTSPEKPKKQNFTQVPTSPEKLKKQNFTQAPSQEHSTSDSTRHTSTSDDTHKPSLEADTLKKKKPPAPPPKSLKPTVCSPEAPYSDTIDHKPKLKIKQPLSPQLPPKPGKEFPTQKTLNPVKSISEHTEISSGAKPCINKNVRPTVTTPTTEQPTTPPPVRPPLPAKKQIDSPLNVRRPTTPTTERPTTPTTERPTTPTQSQPPQRPPPPAKKPSDSPMKEHFPHQINKQLRPVKPKPDEGAKSSRQETEIYQQRNVRELNKMFDKQ